MDKPLLSSKICNKTELFYNGAAVSTGQSNLNSTLADCVAWD